MRTLEASQWRITPTAGGWPNAYRFVNLGLRLGAEVSWVLGASEGFARGDFLIVPHASAATRVHGIADRMGIELHQASQAKDLKVLRLRPARVGIYGGGGAPYNHARILAESGFDASFVSAQTAQSGGLHAFDVFIVPGGGRTAAVGQLRLLGEEGAHQVAEFVRHGGLYLGSCAGAHNVCVIPRAAKPKYGQHLMQMINIGRWQFGDTVWNWQQFPGVGVIESRNLRPDHPVMFGLPETFAMTHYNGPLFTPTTGAMEGASEATPLAQVTGYTMQFTPNEYSLAFSGYRGAAPGSVIEGAIQAGAINAAFGLFGLGRVVVFGSHPEFGYALEMDDYELPARMLANAVFWQSAHRAGGKAGATSLQGRGIPVTDPPGSGLSLIAPRTMAVHAAADMLRARGLDPLPSWLGTTQAMSTFGLSGEAIWRQTLDAFEAVGARLVRSAAKVQALAENAGEDVREVLVDLERAIHYVAPDAWDQDFGYQGLLKTLDIAHKLLHDAANNYSIDLPESQDPYEHDDVSPYHLVAACYYSALGVYLSAWYLLRVYEVRLEDLALLRDTGPARVSHEGGRM